MNGTKFRSLNIEKTVQATGILLKLHSNKPMDCLSLLKMLHTADFIAIQKTGYSITGDLYLIRYFTGDSYQVVPQQVLSLSKDKVNNPVWFKFTSVKKTIWISLLEDPGEGDLCEEEEDILKAVYKDLGAYSPYDVANYPKITPECHFIDPDKPPSVESILKSVGKTDEEIQQIKEDLYRESYLDQVLAK